MDASYKSIKDYAISQLQNLETLWYGLSNDGILLPVDANGKTWTGKESKYVLKDDNYTIEHVLDGLFYSGSKWYLMTFSYDHNHFGLVPCTEAIHVN